MQRDVERSVASFASAKALALVALIASGVALAFFSSATPIVRAHRLVAEALLLLCVADIAAAFLSASYRTDARGWLSRIGLLVLVAATYILGYAAGSGEAGEEGRAHAASALGLTVSSLGALVGHASHALLAFALALALWRTTARAPALSRARAIAWTLAVLGVALLVGAPAALARDPLPAVEGAEVIHAPWIARPLSLMGADHAGGAALVALAGLCALAFLPLMARNSRTWHRCCAGIFLVAALAFASMTLAVSLAPHGH